MDAYPYFENTKPNSIEEAKGLFDAALANTEGAAGGVEVWITETGYPTKGKKSGDAVANTKNARTYWEEVGCPLFGKTNTWWYTLQDSNSDNAITDDTPSFGVVGDDLKPKYNLSCKGVKPKPSSSSAEAEATSTSKSGNSDKESNKTTSESGAEETATGDAATSPSGLTTVSSPAASATETDSGSDSGSDSSSDADNTAAGTSGSESEPSQVPTDAGNQLKGSFGAVVVALGLTFFAL
jgi:glucan endo-1,3-beta-D-glucosidase